MPHPLLIKTGTTVNAGTATTGWAGTTGTPTIATSVPPDTRFGRTPFLKMTSGVNTAAAMDLTLNSVLTGRMGFLFYLEPWDTAAGSIQNTKVVTIYVSNDAGFAAYFQTAFVLRSGWNYIPISRHTGITSNEELSWNVGAGAPTWTNAMVRIRIRIEAVASSTSNLYVCGITDGFYYKPTVIVEFDDNLASVVTDAAPIMATLGIKGTMNVIGSKVGVSGYMTKAQLQTLYDLGWDMCNHTWSHVQNSYYGGTYAYCLQEIVANQKYLEGNGWTRRNCHLHFAAPYGESTYREASDYRQAIKDAGCLTGRTTIERSSGGPFVIDPVLADCLLPDGSAETLQNQYDRIFANVGAGGCLRILFHDIVTPANTQIKWTPTNFTAIMKYLYLLREAGVIDIMTLTEWYEKVKGYSPV